MVQFTVKIRKVRFWPFKKRCSSGRLRLRNTGYTKTTRARILIRHWSLVLESYGTVPVVINKFYSILNMR